MLGESGGGKSSLTWLGVSRGWGVVSDDLVALRELETGPIAGTTIRKTIRVPSHLVNAEVRALGRKIRNHEGLQKTQLDPEALFPGSFRRDARIEHITFLERSDVRSIVPLSRAAALERLLLISAAVLTSKHSSEAFRMLSDLARRADARVARLTTACLSDPMVLELLSSPA
jgi:hypothetical protein